MCKTGKCMCIMVCMWRSEDYSVVFFPISTWDPGVESMFKRLTRQAPFLYLHQVNSPPQHIFFFLFYLKHILKVCLILCIWVPTYLYMCTTCVPGVQRGCWIICNCSYQSTMRVLGTKLRFSANSCSIPQAIFSAPYIFLSTESKNFIKHS